MISHIPPTTNFHAHTLRAVCLFAFFFASLTHGALAQLGVDANKPDAPASQTPPASPPVAALPVLPATADASAMYDHASKFLERKFAELNRAGTPYSPALEMSVRQQQRELAETYAARLAARPKLANDDDYYLGLLNQLAGKTDSVADPLRRFLVEASSRKEADKLKLQNARHVLVELAARAGRMEEAESIFAEYARSQPQNPLDTFRLRLALASAYQRAKNLAPAAQHARAAFDAAKRAETTSGDYIQRAQLINSAGVMLANLLVDLKRDDEAFAVMRELLDFGLTLPSAHVYANAVELLAETGHAATVERSIEESAAHTGTAPEIEIARWLNERPPDEKPLGEKPLGEKPHTLAALRGRVVVLDFWATWCEPCQTELPRLKMLADKFKARGLSVVGVTEFYGETDGQTVTRDAEVSEIAAFAKRLRLDFPVGVADSGANDLRYGVRALPTAVVIDRRGVVRYISIGASESDDSLLAGIVKLLLDEKP
jgi:cytochrome c biogenesis protein CcmG/thiol:disulfide interchange protein DsbE